MVFPNYSYSLRNNPEERSSEASVRREMITVCSDVYAQHINVLCRQNVNTQWHFKPYGKNHVLMSYWRSSRRGFKTKIIVIIGRTKQILIDIFCKLKHEALNAGLIVDNNKTKYLHCTRKPIQPTYIDTGEEQFKQVSSFK
jgi:hypothetical protein